MSESTEPYMAMYRSRGSSATCFSPPLGSLLVHCALDGGHQNRFSRCLRSRVPRVGLEPAEVNVLVELNLIFCAWAAVTARSINKTAMHTRGEIGFMIASRKCGLEDETITTQRARQQFQPVRKHLGQVHLW